MMLTDGYEALEIPILNRALYFKLYVVPKFSTLSPEDQLKTMNYIRREYHTLSSEYSELPAVLKDLPFITVSSNPKLRKKVSEVFDPEDEVYKILYGSQLGNAAITDKFPSGEYSSPAWIEFLRTLGMTSKSSKSDVIKTCHKIAEFPAYYPNVNYRFKYQ